MASLRNRQKEQRLRRIREAAFTLFNQHGYGDTTIEMIAEEAEVSVGTVYNYFGSKIELLARGLGELFAEQEARMPEFLRQRVGRPGKILSEWVVEAFGSVPLDRKLLREVWSALLHPRSKMEGPVNEYLEDYYRMVRHVLVKCVEDGTVRPEIDVDRAVHQITLILIGVEMFYYLEAYNTPEEVRDATFEAVETVVRGLEGGIQ